MGSGRSKSWCWALLGVLLQFLVIIGGRPGLSAPFSPAVASSAARTPGLLLSFRPGAAADARVDALRRFGLQVDPAYRGKRVLRLRAAGGPGLSQLAKALRGHPAVRSAEPDYPLHATALPGDPRFAQLWGLHNTGQTGGLNDADIDALDAWELTTGSTSVTVAVLDSGVDYNHPDLRDNILRNSGGGVIGWDFANDDAEPLDDNGHGTHVAGTIGARGNNGIGVIGVSPTVRIMPVKFLHNDGNGSTSDAIEAIDFAVTHGARVLNCSWGGGAYSQFLLEAVRRARDAGVLVIAAAGNDGRNNDERPEFPAGYNRLSDNVLSIAALDDADRLAGFSNYGAASVDLSAPGVSILSTQPNDQYGYMSGTSMAAPHVSGTAALIWSRYPTLTVTQVRDRLLYNADEPLTVDRRVPARRLNAARALVEDTTSPGSPVALRLVAAAGTGLQFTWTSSGDDGGEGTASRYELYYAREPITRVENAANARGLPRPAPAGTPETFLLPSLAPTDQYYLALRAVDHVGNASPFEYLGPVRTLAPGARVEAFADDVERVPQFTGPKPWAVTTETSRSGSHCYADSPGALYATRVDTALTQGAGVSLVGFVPRLEFYARTDLEPGFDFVYVEVSADDGETWRRLDTSLTGQQDWLPESVPLGEFYGASIRIRFRLVTDEIVTGGGVWLDDIRITGERLIPTAAALPVPPTRLIATDIGQSDVSLAWQDNSNNEISFLVERRAGTGNFGIVAAVGAEVTSYRDTSVVANTLYTYRIRASNAAGDSPPSPELDLITLPLPPTPPGSLTATPSADSVALQWHHAVGADGYRVKRARVSGGPYVLLGSVENEPYYVDFSVQPGVTYYYVVSSVGHGGESVDGNQASATPGLHPPLPPTGLAARVKNKRVQLTWVQSASNGITANRVYRASAAGGPFLPIATVLPGQPKYVDKRVPGRGRYYYRVTAVDTHALESGAAGAEVQVGSRRPQR